MYVCQSGGDSRALESEGGFSKSTQILILCQLRCSPLPSMVKVAALQTPAPLVSPELPSNMQRRREDAVSQV